MRTPSLVPVVALVRKYMCVHWNRIVKSFKCSLYFVISRKPRNSQLLVNNSRSTLLLLTSFFSLHSESAGDSQLLSTSLNVSQSCDLQPHRPISLEESQSVARQRSLGEEEQREGEGLVVDEEAIHQSMELSQRLSLESLSK